MMCNWNYSLSINKWIKFGCNPIYKGAEEDEERERKKINHGWLREKDGMRETNVNGVKVNFFC